MFFPIMIDVEKFNILVAGGGKIAYRKVKRLLEYGGNVTVVSPKFCSEIKELEKITAQKTENLQEANLTLLKKEFEIEDLKGYNIVFAATDNIEVNRSIAEYCNNEKIPVNSVDNHRNSSFINMGFFETEIEDNKTIVAVSSMGKSPKNTKKVKEEIEEFIENR